MKSYLQHPSAIAFESWVTPDTAILPWVELSQDGTGVLLICYGDRLTSTSSGRSDGEFSPPLAVAKWRKR
ncbi:MAG: hypothetical protein ICV55_06910 [Coleofasciculus sp. C3-bin4]|nr:hypothetical protein [Coleofasciculus sp. C3-bin4]